MKLQPLLPQAAVRQPFQPKFVAGAQSGLAHQGLDKTDMAGTENVMVLFLTISSSGADFTFEKLLGRKEDGRWQPCSLIR